MKMKFLVPLLAALALLAGPVRANEGGVPWDAFPQDKLNDLTALQNGARLFVNYCLNCHSAAYMRYNRMRDIGLTEAQIKANLLFATDKVGDTMKVAIDPEQAKVWFGTTPPDLTVIARSRAAQGKGSGADYLYTYLRGFYRDADRPTGWNNIVYHNVAMPNVLWQLQGERAPRYVELADEHGAGHKERVLVGTTQVSPGTLSTRAFDNAVADLVAYLQWMGEPSQGKRERLGVWVVIFLAGLSVIAWRLNAAYWKDVK